MTKATSLTKAASRRYVKELLSQTHADVEARTATRSVFTVRKLLFLPAH